MDQREFQGQKMRVEFAKVQKRAMTESRMRKRRPFFCASTRLGSLSSVSFSFVPCRLVTAVARAPAPFLLPTADATSDMAALRRATPTATAATTDERTTDAETIRAMTAAAMTLAIA